MTKKLLKLIGIGVLLIMIGTPQQSIANDSEVSSNQLTNETGSKLTKMTDTYLGQIIESPDEVLMREVDKEETTNNGKNRKKRSAELNLSEEELKNIVRECNKIFFLAVIGHDSILNPKYVSNQELLAEINARSKYLLATHGGGTDFTAYDFELDYIDVSIQERAAKVIVNRKILFQTTDEENKPIDASYDREEGYVFENSDGKWKLINIIFNTEGFENKYLDKLKESHNQDEWLTTYAFSNLDRTKYEDNMTFAQMIDSDGQIHIDKLLNPRTEYSIPYLEKQEKSIKPRIPAPYNYSKKKACDYAIKYGDKANRKYKKYDADCTNFVSQAIHAGGMTMNGQWYYNGPRNYSRSWTIVGDLRDYLMNHTTSTGHYESLPPYPAGVGVEGTVIQYSTGNEWVHSAIMRKFTNSAIYVAEHTGLQGDKSYTIHGNNLKNKRTFWVARG